MIQKINIETARRLLDFSGGRASRDVAWERELEGAVALHNILAREKFAYLADEVGMGKTFVALGTVALLRHFNPGFRVLYIAPRENIQDKWKKELLNFTANNWRVTDNHVRSYQGTPAYDVALCGNLLDFAHQVMLNPKRDFLLRMTSFSFGLSDSTDSLRRKREELKEEIVWLKDSLFDLRNKERFKENYARAINQVLPHFDLVVVDEGHNLKHGLGEHTAARNRLIATVLGHPCYKSSDFPNYGCRFDRVLMLSATPIENDYVQLWNQLNLFTFGDRWPVLKDPQADQEQKEEAAKQFLVRRLTGLHIGGNLYTKNMYRREWRNGGVVSHDEPLQVPDEKQRLIVALVQKKVAEVIGSDRFNNNFQIGMLASFESFMETAGVKAKDEAEAGAFDDAEQTNNDAEKEGIDVPSINTLARSYRQEFGELLPHPKMDAVAQSLRTSFDSGEKALIFVRRVRSVTDLQDKLNRLYDEWLIAYVKANLPEAHSVEMSNIYRQYQEEHLRHQAANLRWDDALTPAKEMEEEVSDIQTDSEEQDQGDDNNFFAWFFRGEGPKGIFSGAAFNRNRLMSEGSAYSTLFDDNYILWLLGQPDDLLLEIAGRTGGPAPEIAESLRRCAYALFLSESKQKEFRRKRVFEAYQQAALLYLADRATDLALREHARIVQRERYNAHLFIQELPPPGFPMPDDFLRTRTVFTELLKRPALCAALWPQETGDDFIARFRRREQRRELLSAAARLGRPLVDLWLLTARRLESLGSRAQDRAEDRAGELITDYLNLLEQQQARQEAGHTSFRELSEIARHFDLIMAVNFPDVRVEKGLDELRKHFGTLLARQMPVGGMSGGVNKGLVRQFRMPGYPLILITTEVLQEGEDLHTFCSRVFHYGISWTPSSMEQRTGRVDRIHSLAQRRLDNRDTVRPDELLQVYYPHLGDTVERLQVERVYERMNRFIRLMHRSLASESNTDTRVNMLHDIVLRARDIKPIGEQLKSAFEVKEEWLCRDLPVIVTQEGAKAQAALGHFRMLVQALEAAAQVWAEPSNEAWTYVGTVSVLPGGCIAAPGQDVSTARRQPFQLLIRSTGGNGHLLLRCISPIGRREVKGEDQFVQIQRCHTRAGFGKLCATSTGLKDVLTFSIQADILFHPDVTQADEVIDLVMRTASSADVMEHELWGTDQSIEQLRDQLGEESTNG